VAAVAQTLGPAAKGSKIVGEAAADAASGDAAYVHSLQEQQQQQQQLSLQDTLFHTQAPPPTPHIAAGQGSGRQHTVASSNSAASRSPRMRGAAAAAAAAAGGVGGLGMLATQSPGLIDPSFHLMLPGISSTTAGSSMPYTPLLPLPSPGGSAGGSSSQQLAAPTSGPGAAVGTAILATGINPLLTNLPSVLTSKTRGRGETMTRRLSGGHCHDAPLRLTPIAEAVPEPKPLPMHVQTAARDVMTGMRPALLLKNMAPTTHCRLLCFSCISCHQLSLSLSKDVIVSQSQT
jgi:hypothetical protein